MRTVLVQVANDRYELREGSEFGHVIAVFTTAYDAAIYQQAYSNGRY